MGYNRKHENQPGIQGRYTLEEARNPKFKVDDNQTKDINWTQKTQHERWKQPEKMINMDTMKIKATKVEITRRKEDDLPGYKNDHKHYKKSYKKSDGGFNQKMDQEDLKTYTAAFVIRGRMLGQNPINRINPKPAGKPNRIEADLDYSIKLREYVIFEEEVFRGLLKSPGHVKHITFGNYCSELLSRLKAGSDTSDDDRAKNGDREEQIASSD
ncbi:hypothetical protein Tco_0881354 [Tanacetum coccineum]